MKGRDEDLVAVVRCDNSTVTDNYLKIIGDSISSLGEHIEYVENIKDAYKFSPNTIVVVARIIDAIKLYMHGYKKLIMWFQGVEPEESFMSHNNSVRYGILSVLEKYILKHAIFLFFVSDEMKKHYEKKYSLEFDEKKFYCMPCLNTEIHKESFYGNEKYSNNYFAYIGSMAVWQRFEDTIDIYKSIEELGLNNTKLFVFTSEAKIAQELINSRNIRNYQIDYVKNDELPNALKKVKYGFIIRENTIVNRVATPTKISTYLSCGMIPIYSECLTDFDTIAKQMIYVNPDDHQMLERLKNSKFSNIDVTSIYKEYSSIFDTYYNSHLHRQKIEKLLMDIVSMN